jgi:DNA-binding NarL/FixJ family response regulator
MLRILVVDDYEIVRHGVRSLIAANSNWQICGEASTAEEAHALALQTRPDLIILDLSMRGLGGVGLSKLLREQLPDTTLLAFTMQENAETVKAALASGIKGYVLKSDGDSELTAAIHALSARRSYFSRSILDFLTDAAANDEPGPAGFTPREVVVTELIAAGHSNKTIARMLNISVKTVESHRSSALRKANVHTGAELVRFAIKHRLIA